jgi:hypothetical protein
MVLPDPARGDDHHCGKRPLLRDQQRIARLLAIEGDSESNST